MLFKRRHFLQKNPKAKLCLVCVMFYCYYYTVFNASFVGQLTGFNLSQRVIAYRVIYNN